MRRRLTLRNVLIVMVILYGIIGMLFHRFYTNLVIEEAEQHVTAILDSANALRTYIETVQKPVIYRLIESGQLDRDFFDPKILSASYITRHVLANYIRAHNISYSFKLATTNPRNPVNKATPFEAGILQRFRDGSLNEYSALLDESGERYFFRALPIGRNRPSCMRCHSTPDRAPKGLVALYGTVAGFGEKVGDMRALISLKVPLRSIVDRYMHDFRVSMAILAALFALLYLFVSIIIKQDQKLWQERAERDRMLAKANTELSRRVEAEIEHRLRQEWELNEKERLLTHQSKLASMGEMIGNIAHQWRQPLTQLSAILMNIEMQQEYGRLRPETMREKIDEANRQIGYMSRTIDDFRNFFAPEKSKETYRVSVAIARVRRLIDAALVNNGIDLSVQIRHDFLLLGYPNEMAQALLNLISNAKEILLERQVAHPRIVVRAVALGETRVLSVCDNGGGVPEAIMPKIFDPYFSTRHASTGTGVGLYMTRTIIEKHHNGTIRARNRKQGACFCIAFGTLETNRSHAFDEPSKTRS